MYATICRELGLPFVFPGSVQQWNFITDVTDADLLGEQMLVGGTHARRPQNEAFNIANGDVFRWRWLWPQIAEHFGLEWEGYADAPRPLEVSMADIAAGVATSSRARRTCVEPDLSRVASWWHTDGDLGRDIECVTDMTKSRAAGFSATRDSRATFFAYAEQYRSARVIP